MAIFNLVIYSWNTKVVRNKLNVFIEFLNTVEVNLILISEIKVSLKGKFTIRNYRSERYSRQNAAGEFLILIKHNILYKVVKIKRNTVTVNVNIKLANNVHIIAAYSRPTTSKRKI